MKMKIKESQNTQSEYAENALTHNYERKREHEKKKKEAEVCLLTVRITKKQISPTAIKLNTNCFCF